MKIKQWLMLFLGAGLVHKFRINDEVPSLAWDGVRVRNVTDSLEACHPPSHWRLEVNHKKICRLEGKTYYLKAATAFSLREAFARAFAEKNIGINAPETHYFYESKGRVHDFFGRPLKREYYLASQEVEGYKAAAELEADSCRPSSTMSEQSKSCLRDNLVQKIKEEGMARFLVALTFYKDLHLNNWGYNQNGLFLIDVDTMAEDHLGFIDTAISNLRPHNKHNIVFSLNNVKKMKLLYEKMLLKSPPTVHGSVDMSQDMYTALLQDYIEVCEGAIRRIKAEAPELGRAAASPIVNAILLQGFQSLSLRYDDSYWRRFFMD